MKRRAIGIRSRLPRRGTAFETWLGTVDVRETSLWAATVRNSWGGSPWPTLVLTIVLPDDQGRLLLVVRSVQADGESLRWIQSMSEWNA